MQKLVNDVEHCVDDSIRGLLGLCPNLRLIEGSRVVVRNDILQERSTQKVAVICGGGSGHEPAFAGYVGRGFLSAAICGDIFTSPNSSQIITALNTCRRAAGILVFVFNYTGDKLNFAIAIERFKSQPNTCPVKTVFVADDCALTDLKDRSAGRRGLAGGNMIASAAAEQGLKLDEIAVMSEEIIDSMRTIGISLSSCSLPGRGPIFDLPNDEMELGLGVHGEPGVGRIESAPASAVVDKMLNHMTDQSSATSFSLNAGEDIVVLLNNLGGMSQLEMNILAKEALEWLGNRQVKVRRCITGTIMTSLEMRGISITVLKVKNPDWLDYLDAEVESMAWPANTWRQKYTDTFKISPKSIILQESDRKGSVSTEQRLAEMSQSEGLLMREAMQAACKALIEAESELDNLDSQCGDGDCGATMRRGAEAILNLDSKCSFEYKYPHLFLQQIAEAWEKSTGGTSGAIYSLFFLAASNCLADRIDGRAWLEALVNGTDAIMKHGGAKPGDRTMIDPLHAASEIAKKYMGGSLTKQNVEEMKNAIKKAVDATVSMKARAGRASYVASTHLHSPDPGAMAFYHWMTAVLSVVERKL